MKRFLISVAALLAVACATDQPKKTDMASSTGKSKDDTVAVGVIPTALLHDAQRNKDLDISIEYPTRGGPFPLIVWSPGYGGSNRGYEALASYWTSHGYVVIRPSHADAGALREPPKQTRSTNREEGAAQAREERRREREAQQKQPVFRPSPMETFWEKEREPQWRDRARDLTLILDSLNDLETRFPELKDKVDRKKIAVGGHSYGAFTALLLGGMRAGGLQLADPRVTAVLVMSPQGIAADRGLTAESWRDVKVPVMFMTGSGDFGALETETPAWRKAAYENSPAGDKYFVLVDGARNMTFTGLAAPIQPDQDMTLYEPRIDPVTGQQVYVRTQRTTPTNFINDRGIFERIRSIAETFWDAYLKGDAKAKDRLNEGQYGGNVTAEKK